MFTDIFLIILGAVYWVLAPAALLRFYMQLRSMSFRGPLGQYVRALTDWIVLPLRRIFKGTGYDWASLITAFVFELAYVLLQSVAAWNFGLVTTPTGLLVWMIKAVFGVAITAVVIMMFLLILYVVLSFVAPRDENPIVGQLSQMVTPWLRPVRRYVRPVGMVDLSPLVLSVLLMIVYVVLDRYLVRLALSLVL